jgi:hypothetical protein
MLALHKHCCVSEATALYSSSAQIRADLLLTSHQHVSCSSPCVVRAILDEERPNFNFFF